jgi:hypothetical protein
MTISHITHSTGSGAATPRMCDTPTAMSQPPQFPSESGSYPEASQATTVLVLGIISIVLCQFLGPVAWVMGNNELAAIDAGRRAPENRGTANAGRILGIISTVLIAIGIILVILIIAGTFTFSAFDRFN